MKTFSITVGIILLLIFGGIGIKLLFFPVNTANKLIGTAYQAQDKTSNADNAIYNYEYFKQQKESIDALNQKLGNASDSIASFKEEAGDRSKWSFEDKTEYARLNSVKDGLYNQLKDAIADYNAKSNMANRAIFKDSIVPSYIDALTFIKK